MANCFKLLIVLIILLAIAADWMIEDVAVHTSNQCNGIWFDLKGNYQFAVYSFPASGVEAAVVLYHPKLELPTAVAFDGTRVFFQEAE